MLMNTQDNALPPALGHMGFQQLVLKGNSRVPASNGFHHLHHRFFECNYGETKMSLDYRFGTYHDGSPEAHSAIFNKKKKPRKT
jgi:lathosterol oxidase